MICLTSLRNLSEAVRSSAALRCEVLRRTLTPIASTIAVVGVLQAGASFAADPAKEVVPAGAVTLVHGDLQFTEGPTWDGEGQLYFTDIPADRIYRTDGKNLELFFEGGGHCNGLMMSRSGTLYGCSMDGALLAFDPTSQERAVLAGRYRGERFNAPNDLVLDREGGVYFTDPRFRAPEPWPQKIEAVYYRAADGKITRIIEDLNQKAPNGVILSPDEKTLYVVCSMQAEVMAYEVQYAGKIGKGRVFASLHQPEGVSGTGGDGLTVDERGNLYITSRLGVQVFSPKGDFLGTIEVPEQPANVTFGGPDLKTLFMTARTGLYACPMRVAGHAFPGEAKKPGATVKKDARKPSGNQASEKDKVSPQTKTRAKDSK